MHCVIHLGFTTMWKISPVLTSGSNGNVIKYAVCPGLSLDNVKSRHLSMINLHAHMWYLRTAHDMLADFVSQWITGYDNASGWWYRGPIFLQNMRSINSCHFHTVMTAREHVISIIRWDDKCLCKTSSRANITLNFVVELMCIGTKNYNQSMSVKGLLLFYAKSQGIAMSFHPNTSMPTKDIFGHCSPRWPQPCLIEWP